MAEYQVKVFYGENFSKCGSFFMNGHESYSDLLTKIKQTSKSFHFVSGDQIRIRYLDENLMSELFRCARIVEGTCQFQRITLQAEPWNSPAPFAANKLAKRPRQDQDYGTEKAPKRQLDVNKVTSTSHVHGKRYTSPVENLIHSKEHEIQKQQVELEDKQREIVHLEQLFEKPIDTSRSACTKCHLRAGHTRATCCNKPCESSRLCGDLKRHPEEKREVKTLNAEYKLLKTKLDRSKSELENLKESLKSRKRTFSQRILSELINSDKDKYISCVSGREIINWMAINTDSKKIEKICKLVVPGPNANLRELIEQHDTQEELGSSFVSPRSSRSSMVKDLWRQKGVEFPGQIYTSSPSTSKSNIPVPETPDEENYQITLALHESQRLSRHCDYNYTQQRQFTAPALINNGPASPPPPYIPTSSHTVTNPKEVQEALQEGIAFNSTEPASPDENASSLNLLATAANLLSDMP